MRKALIIGLVVPVAVAGAVAWATLHARNPIASARQRMARGDMRGAELYLRQALHEHPQSPEAAFLLGEVDLSLGNPGAAELELRRARQRGYSHAATVLPLGQAYLQERHFDEALRDFDPAHAPAEERADILAIRAAAQLALGDLTGAAASSAQAEAADPNKRETLLTAARVALARDDLAGADTRVTHLLTLKPNDADALLLRSDLAMRRNNPKAALADAQTVLATMPGRPDARLIEGRALAGLGRNADARASLAQVLRVAPKNINANFLNATLALETRDYAGADASMTQIGPVIDKLPRGYYLLGVVKLGLGQVAQAEEANTKFLSRSPDDVPGLKLMALIDLARNRPADALATLRQGKLADHPDSDTLDLTGQALQMSGDLAGAMTSFTAAAKLSPGSTAILNRLAAAHLGLGDSGAAEADLQRSLKIKPDQQVVSEAMVQAALARADFATATDQVAQLRKRRGDTEAVGVLSAQVKLASLDIDGAATELHDVQQRFPDSRQAAFNLVRIYGMQGKRDAAEAQLTDLLHRHPDDQAALDILLPLLVADNHLDAAVGIAEAAHEAAPDNASVTAALAGAYVRAHQTGRATALLDRASAQANPELEVLRARLLAADGKLDQAEQGYRDILRVRPEDTRVRVALTTLLAAGKRYDDARSVLREGLSQSPGNAVLLGALVGVDLRQGGITQALSAAASLRADPQNLPAAFALAGDAWRAVGDRAKAAAAYQAAYKTAPSGELAVKAASALAQPDTVGQAITLLSGWVAGHPQDIAAQEILGSLYITDKRLDLAVQHLDAVLAIRPNDAAALNNMAWVKQQQGDDAQARVLAERAYFETPAPNIADTLGWILVQQGDVQHALPLLAEATVSRDPSSQADAAYHYGYALHQAGRQDEARAQLQKAADAKVDVPEKAEARKLLATFK